MKDSYRVRLDPWAADYDRAIGLVDSGDDEPAAEVDLEVETKDWRAVRPPPAPPPGRAFFVDGVRRIEHRLLVEDGERTVFGLLGSFAVGAAEVRTGVRIGHERVGRLACVGGGLRIAPFEASLPGAGRPLVFEVETLAESLPITPVHGLQNAMRRAEAELARRLGSEADVVVLDGPLTFLTTSGPVVGYVKRLLRTYLPVGPSAVLRTLAVGDRTPLFLVKSGAQVRYSWYARIAAGRVIESPLAGVVRLEASGGLALRDARSLADAIARYLPRFASDATHDPRAPQNLYPIGGLETHLRHRLGDALLIRRAIESRLHEEALA